MFRRIKQLFVSYSRDDKQWTYKFAKALREDLSYSAFVDYRNIHVGTDWWRTICENIEACDCAIFVMTPKSIESLYCRAEIDYLLALNKPILPIMLKTCAFPDELSRKRVQYLTVNNEMHLNRVLLEIQKGIAEVQYFLFEGEYIPPNPLPVRPDEPKPKDAKSAEELFDLAAVAADEGQLELAKSLFEEVVKSNHGRFGMRAEHRLEELRSYMQVVRQANKKSTNRDARSLWREHCFSFGRDFDPVGLDKILGESTNIEGRHGWSNLLPTPWDQTDKDIKSAEETFDLAAEAAQEGKFEQAESLFAEVVKVDPNGRLGRRAQYRLDELRSYAQVARSASKPAMLRDARALWRDHCSVYGSDFDPSDFFKRLADPVSSLIDLEVTQLRPEHAPILVKQAVLELKNHNSAEARRILEIAVKVDPYHEMAWLWLSGVASTSEYQRTCLENVLFINPGNENAKVGIAMLDELIRSQSEKEE